MFEGKASEREAYTLKNTKNSWKCLNVSRNIYTDTETYILKNSEMLKGGKRERERRMHSQHSCFKHLNHRETNKQTGHVWNDVSGAVCVCVLYSFVCCWMCCACSCLFCIVFYDVVWCFCMSFSVV